MRKRLFIIFIVLTPILMLIFITTRLKGMAPLVITKPQPGYWSCWSKYDFNRCAHTLYSVDVVSSDDVWAVGAHGTIVHWDGSHWQDVDSPTTKGLYSVDMLSATDGWAVGEDGTILHWTGHRWKNVPSPVGVQLNSISMVSSNVGWAVGGHINQTGVILYWDGHQWVILPTSFSYRGFESVDMIDATDGWAVGRSGAVHWDGTSWEPVNNIGEDKDFVTMISGNSVWMLDHIQVEGGEGTSYESRIHYWDGVTLEEVPSPTWDTPFEDLLESIVMISENEGWVVGGNVFSSNSGVILHWDGNEWAFVSIPFQYDALHSVAMVSSSDGWAVGEDGAILHWDGSQWNSEASLTYSSMVAIDTFSDSDAWAVGSRNIFHWDGYIWEELTMPNGDYLTSVSVVSPTNVWVGGESDTNCRPVMWYWDGNTWEDTNGSDINHCGRVASISMLSETEGWATSGRGGDILYWDGIGWSEVYSTTSELYGISAVSSTDVWVYSYEWDYPNPAQNLFLHWDGNSWIEISIPTTNRLNTLDMVSASEGWASGGGVILNWDGNEWTEFTDPDGVHFASMISSSDGWVVGGNSKISNWNGFQWSVVSSPVYAWNYNAISMTSNSSGWIVGERILQYHPFTDYVYMPIVSR